MYEILSRHDLAPGIHRFDIAAPSVARKAQPGQFAIIMVDERGERIPLTIAGWDRDRGSVSIVVSAVGTTTRKLADLQAGDSILSFSGPLGLPTEVDKFGTVIAVTVGYSVVTNLPVASALKKAGNRLVSIIRAPSKDSLFGQEALQEVSDQLIVVTGDGSSGECGFITEPLEEVLQDEPEEARPGSSVNSHRHWPGKWRSRQKH